MNLLGFAALTGLLSFAPLPQAVNQEPIPQNPALQEQRARDRIDWVRRTMGVAAYEKFGKKDPRWDRPARESLAVADRISAGMSGPGSRRKDIYDSARLAVQAGCDDPLILYRYALASKEEDNPGIAEYKQRMIVATQAMEKSDYSPVQRGVVMMKHALALMNDKMTAEDRQESNRLLEASLALMPQSLERDGSGLDADKARYDLAWDNITGQKYLLGDDEAAFKKVDAALSKVAGLEVIRLQLEGEFLVKYAWDARGSGMAFTVQEEGWKKFGERLSRADKALRKAWAIESSGTRTPSLLMAALLGLGCERPEIDTWFRRAMEADGDNHQACNTMMEWLDPKWHGSREEVLAFGRACRDTKNWRAKITLLGADAHMRAVHLLPHAEFKQYMAREEVWEDIKAIYEDYLSHRPDDAQTRSAYASCCYVCNRMEESAHQFDLLGDKLTGTNAYNLDQMKRFRSSLLGQPKPRTKKEEAANKP
jgi:hypothetical protein